MRKPVAKFYINSKQVSPPKNWGALKLVGSFDGISNSSQIESDRLEFVLDSARELINYISGNIGIVEGAPFSMSLENQDFNEKLIDGYIDFEENFEIVNPQKVLATFKLDNSIAELEERIKGTTVDLLRGKNVFKASDYTNVDYVVEKKTSLLEIAVLSVTIYLMAKELAEQIYRTVEAVAAVSAYVASGLTGSVGAGIYTIGRAIAELAYAAFLAIQIINLVEQLINLLISPTYSKKAISLYNLISKSFSYYGYEFESSITQLKEWYYFPSGDDDIRKKIGLPNITDYGYTVDEMYQLVKDIFYAKSQIVGNKLILESNNSPYWQKQSSFVLNNVSADDSEKIKYNISDLNNTYFIKFDTDITDEWTIDNYSGTSFEVVVSPKTETNRKRTTIKGFNEVFIPLALGNRKNELNALETTLSTLIKTANKILSIFGGKLKNPIQARVGLLKISSLDFDKPKLLPLRGGKLSSSHRTQLSAKVLWENWHNYKSFVDNNFGGQRLVYSDVRVPFTFQDYNKLVNFNKLTDWKGRDGEVTRLEWSFDEDTAVIDFEVKEIYTKNLVETKIEP